MRSRSLVLSAFVLLSSIIGGAPRSLAATDDPASIVSDFASRALATMRNEDTAAARQERFRQLFRQYFDVEACDAAIPAIRRWASGYIIMSSNAGSNGRRR